MSKMKPNNMLSLSIREKLLFIKLQKTFTYPPLKRVNTKNLGKILNMCDEIHFNIAPVCNFQQYC